MEPFGARPSAEPEVALDGKLFWGKVPDFGTGAVVFTQGRGFFFSISPFAPCGTTSTVAMQMPSGIRGMELLCMTRVSPVSAHSWAKIMIPSRLHLPGHLVMNPGGLHWASPDGERLCPQKAALNPTGSVPKLPLRAGPGEGTSGTRRGSSGTGRWG